MLEDFLVHREREVAILGPHLSTLIDSRTPEQCEAAERAIQGMLAVDLELVAEQMTLGERISEIQEQRTLSKAMQGNKNAKREQNSGYDDNACLSEQARGTSTRYHIARLKRDHPAIAAALARGEYPSVRAAAKAAGLVHEPTPLDYLHRYWPQVSPEDRLRFLVEMLTSTERLLLQSGLWPEEVPEAKPVDEPQEER